MYRSGRLRGVAVILSGVDFFAGYSRTSHDMSSGDVYRNSFPIRLGLIVPHLPRAKHRASKGTATTGLAGHVPKRVTDGLLLAAFV